jgi:hypothetical protein
VSNLFGGNFFGGSKSSTSSSSSNQAYPYLQGALGGTVSNGTGAGNQIANMLGLNGAQAQNQGFNNWRNSTGYQFGLQQGVDSITGNAATQGLLNSGSTLKALDTYGQNYANTQYGNYVNQLQGLLGSGLQGAGILGSAGYTSQSQGTSSSAPQGGGAGSFIGSLLGK